MEERKEMANPLESTSIGILLVKFAVPCTLSMLVSALYNIVDQIFIGHSVGYLGNAATNVVYPFTVVALALALLVGDGGAAQLSLALGSGDRETGHRCVGHALVLSVVLGLLLMGIGLAETDPILRFFSVTQASYTYAWDYMRIIAIGIPFYMFTNGVNGVIRADGAPGYAMAATSLGALINLILDPVAIFALGMGVKGAAWATVIGQVASCVMSAAYFRRPRSFRLQKSSFRPQGAIFGKIARLGLPSLIIQLAIVIIISVANSLIYSYGPSSRYGADIPMSVVGIVMKVFGIVVAFAIGIGLGGQPIVGFNYGAGNYCRVFQTYGLIVRANLVVGIAATLIFQLFPDGVIWLFGSGDDLYREFARMCLRIWLLGILMTCMQKATSIFFQSIGKSVQSTVLSLSRDVVFFVPLILVFAKLGGLVGMLWAAPAADILSCILTVFLVIRERRAVQKKEEI